MELHGAQVTNFGNPFLMRVGERETLAQLRPRIQVRLPGLLVACQAGAGGVPARAASQGALRTCKRASA